jgi:hypothetical protein
MNRCVCPSFTAPTRGWTRRLARAWKSMRTCVIVVDLCYVLSLFFFFFFSWFVFQ